MSTEEKKVVWSLQNNKRTEAERNVFKPTGVKKKQLSTLQYIIISLLVVLISSFSLTFLAEESSKICFIPSFCFQSKENTLLYTLYIFGNILIVLLAIIVAYSIGKKIGDKIKKE
ncbi:hypothetical protein KO494_15815 [Lacinutrix sp. C3R15]|uniref:hypothetical protein n=1 Tax=Flavobacteriaceae TaxID=49546 RepID=UPI001C09371C|nr:MULTISPECIES: hypothetical protein [Flavobacteriaceae]MBU2941018.1 hypothetical protein [Lacinutrix sp. C3R15]MDO6624337.1 hypothetical protein [Oceanihabitans sp. 1_MG-2023]